MLVSFSQVITVSGKRRSLLYGNHDGSLLRRQPRQVLCGVSSWDMRATCSSTAKPMVGQEVHTTLNVAMRDEAYNG
jgi:hypothetical protein